MLLKNKNYQTKIDIKYLLHSLFDLTACIIAQYRMNELKLASH
jgi:hypothetical protein